MERWWWLIDCSDQSDAEEGHNGFPATSQHTRKSNSFDIGICLTLCLLHPCCCALYENRTCMLYSYTQILYVWDRHLAVFVHNSWQNAFVIFLSNEAAWISFLMCSQACRPHWLCSKLLLYPPAPHCVCVCVCLIPFSFRHGTGQPLRSGEAFRSQIPCEKALFPPVQKQISGLPCWDQVYVSVSLPANMFGLTAMWQEKFAQFFVFAQFIKPQIICIQ